VKAPVGKYIRWILTAAIVVFLVLFARTIHWSEAWTAMRSASLPLLAAALGVNFLSLVFKGVRWWLFLKPAGSPSLPLALRATIAGAGLNNILVANGGDAARVVFVTRATGVSSATALATLALERLFDPIGFVILLVYASMTFSLPSSLEIWRIPAQIALAIIVLLLAWFLYSARHVGPEAVTETRSSAASWWAHLKSYLAGFALSARALASGPRFVIALVVQARHLLVPVGDDAHLARRRSRGVGDQAGGADAACGERLPQHRRLAVGADQADDLRARAQCDDVVGDVGRAADAVLRVVEVDDGDRRFR